MGDLPPKVISASDTTVYDRGSGKTREVTRVAFMLGELGPFVEEFGKDEFTDMELERRMDAKRRALERHT